MIDFIIRRVFILLKKGMTAWTSFFKTNYLNCLKPTTCGRLKRKDQNREYATINLNITENNIIYLENKQINLSPPNVLQQQTFWSIGAGLLQELTDLSDIAKTFPCKGK